MSDISEQFSDKQPKLIKFLKIIDHQLMKQIRKYLETHDNPKSDQKKPEKFKLYHDLLIIRVFKANEAVIRRVDTVRDCCIKLKESINFSVATIKQRIQKKLSNLTRDDILSYISENRDFSFDSKRQLNKNRAYQNHQEIILPSNQKSAFSKYQSQIEERKSSAEEENKKSSQIKKKGNQKNQQQYKNEIKNQFQKFENQHLDSNIVIVEDDYFYRISTKNAQENHNISVQRAAKQYLSQKLYQNNDENDDIETKRKIESLFSTIHSTLSKLNTFVPSKQQSSKKWYEIEGKGKKDRLKQFEFWTYDEDQFLKMIVQEVDVKNWKILLKYKTIQNIQQRLQIFGLELPSQLIF